MTELLQTAERLHFRAKINAVHPMSPESFLRFLTNLRKFFRESPSVFVNNRMISRTTRIVLVSAYQLIIATYPEATQREIEDFQREFKAIIDEVHFRMVTRQVGSYFDYPDQ